MFVKLKPSGQNLSFWFFFSFDIIRYVSVGLLQICIGGLWEFLTWWGFLCVCFASEFCLFFFFGNPTSLEQLVLLAPLSKQVGVNDYQYQPLHQQEMKRNNILKVVNERGGRISDWKQFLLVGILTLSRDGKYTNFSSKWGLNKCAIQIKCHDHY